MAAPSSIAPPRHVLHPASWGTVLRHAALALLLLLITAGGALSEEGVSVIRVDGPSFVQRGQNATLKCVYDLKQCSLHGIEWQFNGTNFFSYDADGSKPQQRDDPAVQVDIEKSTQDTVVIAKARLRDSGIYSCTIRSQGDEYYEDTKETTVMVGVLPTEDPHIEPPLDGAEGALKESYSPGDRIYMVCVSPPSYPAPNLSWLINGNKVTEKHLVRLENRRPVDGLVVMRLGLNITLQNEHFQRGQVQLKCTSDLGSLQSRHKSRQLQDANFDPESSAAGEAQPVAGRSVLMMIQVSLQLLVMVVVELLL